MKAGERCGESTSRAGGQIERESGRMGHVVDIIHPSQTFGEAQ